MFIFPVIYNFDVPDCIVILSESLLYLLPHHCLVFTIWSKAEVSCGKSTKHGCYSLIFINIFSL